MERLADAYDPCPCGSGKKFRFCCMKGYGKGKFPIGTLAHYGPDDKTCTKIVAGVILTENAEPILEKFFGDHVFGAANVFEQIRAIFAKYKVGRVAAFGGIMGCPHEEGIDFPMGDDCPHCPWWQGKQGTAAERPNKARVLAEYAAAMGKAEGK